MHVCDIRALAGLEQEGIINWQVDLCDREAAASWIAELSQNGSRPVDILVNNAGGVAGQQGKAIEEGRCRLGQRGRHRSGCHFCPVPGRRAINEAGRAGKIINISSGAALKASLTGVQASCASKHAVLGLTRQLPHELGPFGIRVNAIAPGFVFTNEATKNSGITLARNASSPG